MRQKYARVSQEILSVSQAQIEMSVEEPVASFEASAPHFICILKKTNSFFPLTFKNTLSETVKTHIETSQNM